ncbi:MAG: MurR/RpiR family transcriptional regulator [Clostridia bacterium]|nr:MurR/RpiR family transcriptional regulator [Clostridia bacterium]
MDMPRKNLIAGIEDSLPRMSKGQKAIAAFILANYDQAAYLTAASIGESVGVSESTVVRFAMELGFEGFPHFQKALKEELKVRLTAVQRLHASGRLALSDDILGSVLLADADRLRRASENADRASFRQAVDILLAARRIFIVGVRSSSPLASFMDYYFNYIFDDVRLLNPTGASDMLEQIMPAGRGDVVIGISFPRYSKRTIDAMNYSRKSGASVIAITDKDGTPVSLAADCRILAPSDMMSFVDSLTAPLSVVTALIVALGLRQKERVGSNLEKLERLWDEYDVYDKGGNA